MSKITVYEVYSSVHPYSGPDQVHGLRLEWNVPGDEKRGAVQLRDRVCEEYYRKQITAYVGIRERTATIAEAELSFQN